MSASTASPVESTACPPAARDWRRTYARRLMFTDFLVLIWVMFGVQMLWFGVDAATLSMSRSHVDLAVSYSIVSVVLIAAWMIILAAYDTRGLRVLGTGPDEYKLIANSSLHLFGLLALVAYLFHIDVARGYILIAFPLGIVVLIFSRWMWRQWLVVQRTYGQFSSRVILVGSPSSTARINRELSRQPGAGYWVVGACVTGASAGDVLPGTQVPVFGSIDTVHAAIDVTGADTVVVTGADEMTAQLIRELSWSLEPGLQHLVVAPRLIDVGGPRIHMRPVAGLPLMHVETPSYEGRKIHTKRAFDLVVSGLLLVVLSPVFALVALAIRVGDAGPVLFSQARVGFHGDTFRMFKFRSMVVDAETRLADTSTLHRAEGNVVLFKMRNDPRITPLGRFLRRWSLDELPQLVNVFLGTMSLVGPRPPLAAEVDQYESHVHRRFLVKPGITGLWQINGRSTLSWEDSVRLDLYYVENWSLAGDFTILWRTAKTVLQRTGAY
ncbi:MULTISPECIES: sugar transferase [unclassified Cryobacterium]|uniref:sugar transferase n=2 Tax=Bacteria TaxID=2 RepID=UPI002AB59309|nr:MULTISPECIES: sugar transferase [unclassified Cryobacterium]MDY7526487.1 sugar transferase [Cryobacterium sp. 10C2]MDY7557705.1 sugar transferase [Cryobacterium sp. 10C3]MEB0002615.1 sugar transferase [Cryobacterium sp. RTC2.1]MEB0201621.1 sugar transferase [Cryobacterium sp. 5I3]MEB0285054.1 sugar transferase [Cryobacterium sp. 10S3]